VISQYITSGGCGELPGAALPPPSEEVALPNFAASKTDKSNCRSDVQHSAYHLLLAEESLDIEDFLSRDFGGRRDGRRKPTFHYFLNHFSHRQ
jgi:hypothetical protein